MNLQQSQHSPPVRIEKHRELTTRSCSGVIPAALPELSFSTSDTIRSFWTDSAGPPTPWTCPATCSCDAVNLTSQTHASEIRLWCWGALWGVNQSASIPPFSPWLQRQNSAILCQIAITIGSFWMTFKQKLLELSNFEAPLLGWAMDQISHPQRMVSCWKWHEMTCRNAQPISAIGLGVPNDLNPLGVSSGPPASSSRLLRLFLRSNGRGQSSRSVYRHRCGSNSGCQMGGFHTISLSKEPTSVVWVAWSFDILLRPRLNSRASQRAQKQQSTVAPGQQDWHFKFHLQMKTCQSHSKPPKSHAPMHQFKQQADNSFGQSSFNVRFKVVMNGYFYNREAGAKFQSLVRHALTPNRWRPSIESFAVFGLDVLPAG